MKIDANSVTFEPQDMAFVKKFRSVYKELHADHETGAADNK